MRRLIFALAAFGLVAAASMADTASAYTCHTSCGGNSCTTQCDP